MFKAGDKIRILFDGANHANVHRGDEFVVCEVFDDEDVKVEGKYNWLFSSYSYEVIHTTPPQKITQNGYEYSLVGPVKPEWLVDGAWVVRKNNGETHQIHQQSEDKFSATSSFSRATGLTAKMVAEEFRHHTASDWKWGDWAMYAEKRVFVVGGVDNTGRVLVSYPDIYPLGKNDSDRNFLFVPHAKLTPTF